MITGSGMNQTDFPQSANLRHVRRRGPPSLGKGGARRWRGGWGGGPRAQRPRTPEESRVTAAIALSSWTKVAFDWQRGSDEEQPGVNAQRGSDEKPPEAWNAQLEHTDLDMLQERLQTRWPCEQCRRRSELISAVAHAITRPSALGGSEKEPDPSHQGQGSWRVGGRDQRARPHRALPARRIPQVLTQLNYAPAVLYATCTVDGLRGALTTPHRDRGGGSPQPLRPPDHVRARARPGRGRGHRDQQKRDGLNAIAHHGALDAEGQTIAVMPCAPELPART